MFSIEHFLWECKETIAVKAGAEDSDNLKLSRKGKC